MSNLPSTGVMNWPREKRSDGILPVAVTIQHNATFAKEVVFIEPTFSDLAKCFGGLRSEVKAIVLSDLEPIPRQMTRAVEGRAVLATTHIIAGWPDEVAVGTGAQSLAMLNDGSCNCAMRE